MNEIICLVTGASSGIGAKTAIELSKMSTHIYILGRNIEKLEIVNDQIVQNECKCTIIPLDITESNALENLAKSIAKKESKIDILISCAGIIGQLSTVESINESKFKEVIELNYLSNFKLIKSFHYLLKNSDYGRLIVVSSNEKEIGKHYWGIYQPIMKALNELVITYANENLRTNIKANIVCPSAVDTEFRDSIMPGENKNNLLSTKQVSQEIVKLTKKTLKDSGKIFEI